MILINSCCDTSVDINFIFPLYTPATPQKLKYMCFILRALFSLLFFHLILVPQLKYLSPHVFQIRCHGFGSLVKHVLAEFLEL